MTLKNNPFFLLKVSCNAGREAIVAGAEKMSSEVSLKARDELLDPEKRLAAEMDWFVDADEAATEKIRTSIENDDVICTDGLTGLSRLNALLHNLSLNNSKDSFELGFSILEINENFATLNAEEIAENINRSRNAAGLSTVQPQDVVSGLGRKREEIGRFITEKTAVLWQCRYTSDAFMMKLAWNYKEKREFWDGAVLADVFDQYETGIQQKLEESTENLEKQIEKIKGLSDTSSISKEIQDLRRKVSDWEGLAWPLQQKCRAEGKVHENSDRVVLKLRTLSRFLYNDKHMTRESLDFLKEMKTVFWGVDELADAFAKDAEQLEGAAGDKAKLNGLLNDLLSIQKEGEEIKASPTAPKINEFMNRVKKLDQRIKAMDTDPEVITKNREKLCYTARAVGTDLHNKQNRTAYALIIARALKDEFTDMVSLRYTVIRDVHDLETSQQKKETPKVNPSLYVRSTGSSPARKRRPGLAVLITLAVVIVAMIVSGSSNKGPSSGNRNRSTGSSVSGQAAGTTARPTAQPTARPEKRFSSGSKAGDYVFVNITFIEARHGIYTTEAGGTVRPYTTYHTFICECQTESGGTVWVSFPATTYRNRVDSSIDIYEDSPEGFHSRRIRFAPAATVHGKVVRASSVAKGLSGRISQDYIIEYDSMDIPEQDADRKMTVSIRTIVPSYTIKSGGSSEVTHLLCEFTDSSGNRDWIYMSIEEYKKYFDPDAKPESSDYADEKIFPAPKEITVTSVYADDYIEGATDAIGREKMYMFSEDN